LYVPPSCTKWKPVFCGSIADVVLLVHSVWLNLNAIIACTFSLIAPGRIDAHSAAL
jgi:hypothetical protein